MARHHALSLAPRAYVSCLAATHPGVVRDAVDGRDVAGVRLLAQERRACEQRMGTRTRLLVQSARTPGCAQESSCSRTRRRCAPGSRRSLERAASLRKASWPGKPPRSAAAHGRSNGPTTYPLHQQRTHCTPDGEDQVCKEAGKKHRVAKGRVLDCRIVQPRIPAANGCAVLNRLIRLRASSACARCQASGSTTQWAAVATRGLEPEQRLLMHHCRSSVDKSRAAAP